MGRTPWLAVGLGLVLIAAAPAADTYTIRIKQPAPGDRFREEKTAYTDAQTRLLGPDGKMLLEKADKSTKAAVFTETILEKPEGQRRPTKLTRRYEKAQITTAGKTEDLPYQGKTVLIEKKDGRYHFTIEGGSELTGKDAEGLEMEFNHGSDFDEEQAMLPDKPVAVGQEWKPNLKAIAEGFGKANSLRFDADKAEGSGRLVRVYDKNGVRYGVLKFHLELPIRQVGEGKTKIVAEAGSKWTFDIKLDNCIDGSRLDGTNKLDFHFKVAGPVSLSNGQEGKVFVGGDGGTEQTEKELPKQ